MTSGELIGCFGLTEPDGSNLSDMVTKAEDRATITLNGAKMWMATASPTSPWSGPSLTASFAAHRREGRPRILRAGNEEAFPEGERHPDSSSKTVNLQGPHASGREGPPRSVLLPQQRPLRHFGARCNGLLPFRQDLRPLPHPIGQPVAAYQLVQTNWHGCSEIAKGQLLAYHGRKKDDGSWFNEQISLAKMNNVTSRWKSPASLATSRRTVCWTNTLMRHMATESVKTYEGTHDIQIITVDTSWNQAFTRQAEHGCAYHRIVGLLLRHALRKQAPMTHWQSTRSPSDLGSEMQTSIQRSTTDGISCSSFGEVQTGDADGTVPYVRRTKSAFVVGGSTIRYRHRLRPWRRTEIEPAWWA